MKMRTIRFYVHDTGDMSVGIWPLYEEVVVIVSEAGVAADKANSFQAQMVEFLKDFYDCQAVLTEEEEKDRLEQEKRENEMYDHLEREAVAAELEYARLLAGEVERDLIPETGQPKENEGGKEN